GKPFAGDAFAAVSQALDRYANSWSAMHTGTCEARAEQSGELFDLRMECLGERLEQLRAQVTQLASADADLVERAPTIAFSLPPPAMTTPNCAPRCVRRATPP